MFGGQEYPCCGTKIQTRNCLLRGGCKPTWYSPLGKNQQCLRDCLHFMLFSLFNSIVFYNVSIGKAIIAKGKGWSGVLETLESKIHLIRGSNARSQRRENPGPQQIPPISINPENTNKGQKTVTGSSDVVISHTKKSVKDMLTLFIKLPFRSLSKMLETHFWLFVCLRHLLLNSRLEPRLSNLTCTSALQSAQIWWAGSLKSDEVVVVVAPCAEERWARIGQATITLCTCDSILTTTTNICKKNSESN